MTIFFIIRKEITVMRTLIHGLILASLALSVSACGTKEPVESHTASAAPAPKHGMLIDDLTNAQPEFGPAPAVVETTASSDDSDPDALMLTCGNVKIHVWDFGPRDHGGPVGTYTADAGNYHANGEVEETGVGEYTFNTGDLGKRNAIINASVNNQYTIKVGITQHTCKV